MSENIATDRTRGSKRSAKKSTRIDLTPMVDLGFLLITFFVFTTAMTKPKVLDIRTPKNDSSANDPVCESCAITLLPSANDQLFYYEGSSVNAVYKTTNYSPAGLRTLLMKKKNAVASIGRDAVLIIKPCSKSTFKNLINIIDESNITGYKRYYLDSPDGEEVKKIKD